MIFQIFNIYLYIINNNKMNSDNDIRNQIIITGDTKALYLKYLSNIEVVAMYSKNKNNYKIFKKLFLKMYNINKNDQIFYELIRITINCEKEFASIKNIKLLIKYNIDLNYHDNSHYPFIILCCLRSVSSIELINLLIESGASIYVTDIFEKTPLMHLIQGSEKIHDLEIIKLLISKGSPVNFTDDDGDTALMTCFKLNHNILIRYDIIKILLDNKADIYIKNKKNKNILNIVEENTGRNSDIYSLIFNYKNIKDDHFCKCDIDFIYKNF